MTAHDDYRAAVLGLAPVAYWEFQGAGSTGLADSSGNGHTLTAVGVQSTGNTVIGWDGFKYASFNGTTQGYTIGGTNPIPASGPLTIMGICQPTKVDAILLSNENAPATITQGVGLAVANAGGNGAYLGRAGTGTGSVLALDTVPFSQYGSGYQLVGCVIDDLALTLYINGNPIKSTLWATRDYRNGTSPRIGQYPSASGFFKGAISDLYVLNAAQSLESIREIAALTPNPTTPSIQALNEKLDLILASVRRTFSS